MIKNLYNSYFAKDKALRHYTQHILVGFVGYLILHFIFKLEFKTQLIFLFIIATFLIDLDGFSSIFIWKNKIPEAKEIVEKLKNKEFKVASDLAAKNHKKLNRLIVHNVFGLLLFLTLFILSVVVGTQVGIAITGAVLSHFSFDILDDVYQLGHIKNWLWPV